MRIDATHRSWFVATVVITVASTGAYIAYAITAPDGPKGGSWFGLFFGVAAALMIYYAGFLGARKKMLLARIGSVTWWMRGHLWLGFLSLPFVLFHGAFHFGGTLTTVLMILLIFVVISGIIGAALQHVMPEVMRTQVVEEHTYEQHERVKLGLRKEAYEIVASACGPLESATQERADLESLTGSAPKQPKKTKEAPEHEHLQDVYLSVVLPYFRGGHSGQSPLVNSTKAAVLFDHLRPRVDASLHETLDALSEVCESWRQQDRQGKLHRVLHSWLLFHVPISMALMVLTAVHAVMALYY